tara:strand:+ start:89 stop:274 length:186 start_codon:yes stop_codon:yes gene_type:complete
MRGRVTPLLIGLGGVSTGSLLLLVGVGGVLKMGMKSSRSSIVVKDLFIGLGVLIRLFINNI